MSSPALERLQMQKEKVYLDEVARICKMLRNDLVLAQEKAKLHAAQVAFKLKERAQAERNQKLLDLARAELEEDPEIVELRRQMDISAQASAESLTELRRLNDAEVIKPKKKKAKTSASSTSSAMNQSMWAPQTPSFSQTLTSSNSSLPSRSGASKVQCADYKDGQNFVTWLRSFEWPLKTLDYYRRVTHNHWRPDYPPDIDLRSVTGPLPGSRSHRRIGPRFVLPLRTR